MPFIGRLMVCGIVALKSEIALVCAEFASAQTVRHSLLLCLAFENERECEDNEGIVQRAATRVIVA